ncbi:MAG TPA: SAF domain-containing protein, partial [Candidatus Acidoferrales bacterium]|nr:SAF domain-containing protein [Candidatus Acidoferrales bacterium]
MRRTSRLLVLFGIGLAVLTFVLIVALLPGKTNNPGIGGATPTPAPNVNVVVAAQDIGLGVVVTADMLTTQSVPRAAAAGDSFLVPSQVIGQTTRRSVVAGAQIHKADFDINQASKILVVPPGKRAMAVSVTELTGVGKLVYVGDTV